MRNSELTKIILHRKRIKARKRARYQTNLNALLAAAKEVAFSPTNHIELASRVADFIAAAQKLAPKKKMLWLDLDDVRKVAENVLRDFE